jgi:NAD(P)-dependent dehydrogenase (short-subunit alcohol dehydrogenase family)
MCQRWEATASAAHLTGRGATVRLNRPRPTRPAILVSFRAADAVQFGRPLSGLHGQLRRSFIEPPLRALRCWAFALTIRPMTANPLAIVTGANGNLGNAVVARLTAGGWRVARVERNVMHLGEEFDFRLDYAEPESITHAFAEATRRAGRLDAVIHTVGAFRGGHDVMSVPDSEFVELFQTNVMTTLHVLRAALAAMIPQRSGNIAVVVSSDADAGAAERAAYTASKAAQLRLVESVAAEVQGYGIRLNAILPHTLDTPQNRAAMPEADRSSWLQLRDVAELLTYLVSGAAAAIHGQALRL